MKGQNDILITKEKVFNYYKKVDDRSVKLLWTGGYQITQNGKQC